MIPNNQYQNTDGEDIREPSKNQDHVLTTLQDKSTTLHDNSSATPLNDNQDKLNQEAIGTTPLLDKIST